MKDWRPVDRRYLREFIPAMVAYVLVTIFVWPFVDHVHNVVGRVLLSLLPMVPIGFVARALIHRIRDGDELENRLFLEATAIASITVGMASFFRRLPGGRRRLETRGRPALHHAGPDRGVGAGSRLGPTPISGRMMRGTCAQCDDRQPCGPRR